MKLAIVMPAYNEEGCIESVVRRWLKIASRHEGFVLVVNDGSKDQTGTILDRLAEMEPNLKVVHQENAGHGAAVLNAYRTALSLGSERVFQTDSDDQFDPEDFEKIWVKKDEAPFVSAMRKTRADAFHRLVITKLVRMLNFVFFGVSVTDANVPFRLFHASLLGELLKLVPTATFAPNIFLTVLAARLNAGVFDVPVTHQARKTGQVSIIRWKLVKVCFLCLRQLIAFRASLSSQAPALRRLEKENRRAA